MIIKTKSIRDLKKDTDGIRLLVARYPGRVKRTHYDLWYPALAPSEYLLQRWKNRKTTWENFEAEYRKEISRSANAQAHLETLREISKSITNPNPDFITLLCFELERNPHCHRHILKKIIEGK
ncbi:MAG TPA: DUF488 family protein [Nitrososphaeraceae archaeon]